LPPVPPELGLSKLGSLKTEPGEFNAFPGYWGPVVPSPIPTEKLWQVCIGCPVAGPVGFAGECGFAANAGPASPNVKPLTTAKVRNDFLMSASPRVQDPPRRYTDR
jgi:hypothetical protein